MQFIRAHRIGAVSFLALVAAALLSKPIQGEAWAAQVGPDALSAVQAANPIAANEDPVAAANDVSPSGQEIVSETPDAPLDQSSISGVISAPVIIFAEGVASYYGAELAGNRTASGERFDPNALTAAHRTLPMGTMLRVTNLANGKSVIVRVNDRGPFVKGRIIDVSRGAAEKISMLRSGTAHVMLERIS